MHILTLGLNHRTAPVEIREKLAFAESSRPQALTRLVEGYGLGEAAILSTCNRSEIYAAGDDATALERVWRFLAETRDVDVSGLSSCFYELHNEEAAQHLFSVACGIDSLVVGESQILMQVRESLELAQGSGTARTLVNELFQRSLRVGKRARTETDIGRGRLSVSTAAVELATQIFESLEGRHALLLGAGEMIELTARYLMGSGIGRFHVANRTFERGAELARACRGEAVQFADFPAQLEHVDIVISSTSAPDFVIEQDAIQRAMRKRRGRPLFLIDIAVPRDIDPAVRDLDNVFLFDIDDLEQVVASNRADREQEIAEVQQLIQEELRDFRHWLRALSTGPLFRALRERADDLRQVELGRWQGKLAHLSGPDHELVEAILRAYANKLLHEPLVQMRALANSKDGFLRLDTVRQLFDLDPDADSAE